VEHVRTCIFKPYFDPAMPRFRLKVWDTGLTDYSGKYLHKVYKLAYELSMHQGRKTVLFKGFCASPLHTINSDATMLSIMDLLTLRPGDTDKEYFAKYTPEQLEFCARHAEALSYEVWVRFGE
jgi:hypothetical protein